MTYSLKQSETFAARIYGEFPTLLSDYRGQRGGLLVQRKTGEWLQLHNVSFAREYLNELLKELMAARPINVNRICDGNRHRVTVANSHHEFASRHEAMDYAEGLEAKGRGRIVR